MKQNASVRLATSKLTSLILFDFTFFFFQLIFCVAPCRPPSPPTTSINSLAAGRFAAAFICQHYTLPTPFSFFFAAVLWPADLGRLAAVSHIFVSFSFSFFGSATDWCKGFFSKGKSFSTQLSRVRAFGWKQKFLHWFREDFGSSVFVSLY